MVIDGIEGNVAVIEFGGQTMDIPLACLPDGASEGDALRFVIDNQERKTRASQAQERLERLQATDQLPDHIEL